MKKSERFTLNKEDMISLGKGVLITMAGAGLTYISEMSGKIDFGEYTPIVVVVLAFLVNVARKFIAGKAK